MHFYRTQAPAAGDCSARPSRAGQLPCAEAPAGPLAPARQFAGSALAVVLLLAPFVFIVALRVAVGQYLFLWGIAAFVAVLMLAGLGAVLVRAAAALGRPPAQAGASLARPPAGVPGGEGQEGLRHDRHRGRRTAA